jgi:hypothetical protein
MKKISLAVLFLFALTAVLYLSTNTSSGHIDPADAGACIVHLRQIDAAINQFAQEHHKTNGSPIDYPNDLTPYIKLNRRGKIPPCPNGGVYTIGRVGDPPTCSIMVHNLGFGELTIRDVSGSPIAGALVTLNFDSGDRIEFVSDKQGSVNFARYPVKNLIDSSIKYSKIVVSKDGYQPETINLPTNTWPLKVTLNQQM